MSQSGSSCSFIFYFLREGIVREKDVRFKTFHLSLFCFFRETLVFFYISRFISCLIDCMNGGLRRGGGDRRGRWGVFFSSDSFYSSILRDGEALLKYTRVTRVCISMAFGRCLGSG